MNRMEDSVLSPSYFWDCLRLSEDCPFISNADPKLYYFALGLVALYVSLVLMILFDLKFYWGLDNLYHQVNYYLNFIKRKIRDVQINQRRLVSAQERTEKQLKKSIKYNHLVTVLRSTLVNDPEKLVQLTKSNPGSRNDSTDDNWNEITSLIEFDENGNFVF
ncbi:unnamed protein product [Leptosia nina]|uniref:ATP synthase F0 subunit 8 n=1 Tax=Leptosia nina TaxID=320188 RepID=A0AAV1J9L7_9NEOP